MMVVAPKKMTDRNFNETDDEPEDLDGFFHMFRHISIWTAFRDVYVKALQKNMALSYRFLGFTI